MKIIVEREGNCEYLAYLEGDPKIWGRGETMDEAIGILIRSYPHTFKINVEEKV